MQIEQIIGGVNGDVTAQAIQLRMRTGSQTVLSLARLVAVDATGANPVLVKDMTTNVGNGATGSRVLITTSSFANYTSIPIPLASDFTITNPIPASYLAAGQLRFTDDSGTIYWSVSWGGDGFTGLTTGNTFNDFDGDFGPPVATALPSTTLQALQFTGSATALSTKNVDNYAVTGGAATFVNNTGTSFTVAAPPTFDDGDFNESGEVDGDDLGVWQEHFGLTGTATHLDGDADDDDDVDGVDYLKWQEQATVVAVPALGAVPEPTAAVLASMAGLWAVRRRGRSRRAWPAG